MQLIQHNYKNIHPIFNDIEKLYYLTSTRYLQKSLINPSLDVSLKPIYDLFTQYGYTGNIQWRQNPSNSLKLPSKKKNSIIVCFSGGKDSIAVIKRYMLEGYDIHLYHMKGINFTLTDEYLACQEFAKLWKLPLHIDEIKLKGHHDYVEHPMKNMIIANGALNYGIREGVGTNIAFGNYTSSTLDSDNFEYCGGDDIEMWQLYEDVISHIIPRFKINLVLNNLNDTLEEVCQYPTLMDMSISCLGRANLRQCKHDWVKNKYGIILPKHRCGQCYKCCIEYIYMADHNLQDYNKSYYEYCLKKLKQNVEVEDSVTYTDEEVWNHYFFYGMKKSKYYG